MDHFYILSTFLREHDAGLQPTPGAMKIRVLFCPLSLTRERVRVRVNAASKTQAVAHTNGVMR